jgi:hypothetical protein
MERWMVVWIERTTMRRRGGGGGGRGEDSESMELVYIDSNSTANSGDSQNLHTSMQKSAEAQNETNLAVPNVGAYGIYHSSIST